MGDVVGGSYALTLFSPIRPERVFDLRRTLADLPVGASSPFSRVPGTHCARWVIIPQLVYEAFGQRPDPLDRPYLLFTANFDGDLDPYLHRLHSAAHEAAHAVWGTCVGYPGEDDARRFVRYLKAHRVTNTLVVAAYPNSTVDDVLRSLDVHQRFLDLVVDAEGQPAETLLERFRDAFPAGVKTTDRRSNGSNGSEPANPRPGVGGLRWGRVEAVVGRRRSAPRDRRTSPAGEDGGRRGPDLANLQGLVRGYRGDVAAAVHIFARVVDRNEACRWLRETAEASTAHHRASAEDRPPPVSMAFTFAGLRSLGVPESSLATFPAPFREGLAARARVLGDVGASSPREWEPPFTCAPEGSRTGEGVHLLVAVYAQGVDEAERRRDEVEAQMRAGGLSVLGHQAAHRFPDRREHFGFVDGIAQPRVAGLPTDRQAPPEAGPPIATGEFLLGHADEEGLAATAPSPSFLARDGTYLVYRKLSQDVPAFQRLLTESAERLGCDREWLAAKLVGRWRDESGAPVEVHPHDDPRRPRKDQRAEDARFGYRHDPEGRRCPLGAHIRRANPRDGLAAGEGMVRRHRILRRGMPYGERDAKDRGLVFLALVADIERQFEFVQRQWLNDGNIFGLGADADVITGGVNGSSKFVIQGAPPRCVRLADQLVTTRAGEYFFLPGIDALRCIASGWPETVAGCDGSTDTRWRR